MPLIKPRTRGTQIVRPQLSGWDRETKETRFVPAQFVGESTGDALNEIIDTVLTNDEQVKAWRAKHTASVVPPPSASQPLRTRRQRRRADSPVRVAANRERSTAARAWRAGRKAGP